MTSRNLSSDNLILLILIFLFTFEQFILIFNMELKGNVKNNPSNHVVPAFGRNGWAVKKSDATRASRIFKTKEEAIAYGTITSNTQRIPLYVHNTNGIVANKIYPAVISTKSKTSRMRKKNNSFVYE